MFQSLSSDTDGGSRVGRGKRPLRGPPRYKSSLSMVYKPWVSPSCYNLVPVSLNVLYFPNSSVVESPLRVEVVHSRDKKK